MGRLTHKNSKRNATFVQSWDYQYDAMNNIKSRVDNISLQGENFSYDNLNRLLDVYQGPLNQQFIGLVQSMNYDNLGNMTHKTDVGNMQYSPTHPFQMEMLTENPQTITSEHVLEYFVSGRTKTIEDNDKKLQFTYGSDLQRRKMEYFLEDQLQSTTLYPFGNYEEVHNATTNDVLKYNYIGSPDGLIAIRKTTNGTSQLYYTLTDHLGSIDALCNTSGDVVERYSYDAWGNRRNPTDWTLADIRTSFITNRGFTGHEHLDKFGLINANARMYEPLTGKFLAPDPFVQAPDYSQSFNRYAYCWNNPVKYSDPSGEFFYWDSFVVGFIHGFFSTSTNRFNEGWKEAKHRSHMDRRIWNGLFVTDENKSDLGKAWEIASKFTWQAPQTIGGLLTAHAHNTLGLRGGVESVNYKYGATVVKTRSLWGAVAQGNFIVGDRNIEANPHNPLFQHEYGHYIQSQDMGLAYYPRVGIPSAKSEGVHDFHPVEQDANRRAFMYFNKHVDNFYVTEFEMNNGRGWDFFENPLNIDGMNTENQYVDYKNPTHLTTLVNNLSVYSKWYDYASWMLFPIGGPIWVGLINSNIYNK